MVNFGIKSCIIVCGEPVLRATFEELNRVRLRMEVKYIKFRGVMPLIKNEMYACFEVYPRDDVGDPIPICVEIDK